MHRQPHKDMPTDAKELISWLAANDFETVTAMIEPGEGVQFSEVSEVYGNLQRVAKALTWLEEHHMVTEVYPRWSLTSDGFYWAFRWLKEATEEDEGEEVEPIGLFGLLTIGDVRGMRTLIPPDFDYDRIIKDMAEMQRALAPFAAVGALYGDPQRNHYVEIGTTFTAASCIMAAHAERKHGFWSAPEGHTMKAWQNWRDNLDRFLRDEPHDLLVREFNSTARLPGIDHLSVFDREVVLHIMGTLYKMQDGLTREKLGYAIRARWPSKDRDELLVLTRDLLDVLMLARWVAARDSEDGTIWTLTPEGIMQYNRRKIGAEMPTSDNAAPQPVDMTAVANFVGGCPPLERAVVTVLGGVANERFVLAGGPKSIVQIVSDLQHLPVRPNYNQISVTGAVARLADRKIISYRQDEEQEVGLYELTELGTQIWRIFNPPIPLSGLNLTERRIVLCLDGHTRIIPAIVDALNRDSSTYGIFSEANVDTALRNLMNAGYVRRSKYGDSLAWHYALTEAGEALMVTPEGPASPEVRINPQVYHGSAPDWRSPDFKAHKIEDLPYEFHSLVIELKAQLAAIEHQRWADWMKYFFSKCTERADGDRIVPGEYARALERQIATHYRDLAVQDQNADIAEIDRYWPLVEPFVLDSLSQRVREKAKSVTLDRGW